MTYNRKNIPMKILPYILFSVLILATSCASPTWAPATHSEEITLQTEELYYIGGTTTIAYETQEQRKQLIQLVEKEFGETYKVITSYRPVPQELLVVDNIKVISQESCSKNLARTLIRKSEL